MYIYPFLAMFWAALGIAILVWYRLDPHARIFESFGSAAMASWVAIALGAYNLVRWWGVRTARRTDREMARLRQRHRDDATSTAGPPDPAFDFGPGEDTK